MVGAFNGAILTIPDVTARTSSSYVPCGEVDSERTFMASCVVEDGDVLFGTSQPSGYRIDMRLRVDASEQPSEVGMSVRPVESKARSDGKLCCLHMIALQLSRLSWLSASPLYPRRATTLPIHCSMVERMMAGLCSLEDKQR